MPTVQFLRPIQLDVRDDSPRIAPVATGAKDSTEDVAYPSFLSAAETKVRELLERTTGPGNSPAVVIIIIQRIRIG